MSDYLDPNNEELLKDFFAEAEQQVETLESNVLVIENDPTNHDAIDEIFRAAHTLKGGSATVEMNELSGFTHKVEDVLDEIRSDRLAVTEPVVDVLLSSIDVIKAMMEARRNGEVYSEDVTEIEEKLKSYIPEKGDKKASHKPPAGTGPSITPIHEEVSKTSTENTSVQPTFNYPELSESEYLELKGACEDSQKLWLVSVKFDENNPMNSVGGIQVFAALKALGSVLKTVPDFDSLYEDEFHETVFYYLASESDSSKIEDTAFLGDVTLCTDAHIVEDPQKKVSAPEKESAVTEPAQTTALVTEKVKPQSQIQPSAQTSTEEKEVPKTDGQNSAVKHPEKKENHAAASNQNSVLRVDSRRIDYLLNLVSEIVIAKAAFNQLSASLTKELTSFQQSQVAFREKINKVADVIAAHINEAKKGKTSQEIRAAIAKELITLSTSFDGNDVSLKAITTKFRSSTQNLGRITGELQEGVMKIRMVPINQIFSRFPRVVRDLQRELDKKIELVIEGEDTELDKSVVEDLLDPIMHCVRNSVDHGIESPEKRLAAGKSETGTVLLKAENEGNQIVIEIADDGAGIDVEKVKNKAIQKGLIHPDKVLTDQEAYQLIFEAGFSTADKISNISGRGVGLDVVKTMIEKLKGTVSVSSKRGEGTTFTIKLPLTLAIIQGLLVKVGTQVYSIPIASVIESQRIKPTDIKTIDNYEVLNVRNEVISVLRLSRLFGIKETKHDDFCNIVIVGSKDKKVGIMVDSLIGEEDVVIKPLKDQFTVSPGIAGASILGDGSVSLIIDVSQLLDLSLKQDIDAQRFLEA